jgi:tRNA(His) 5'-end guanylyltransferase
MKDSLGDRIKEYESQTCGTRLLDRLPVVCRLDGKNFSRFTKGLKRPYDERLSNLMVETTKYLVKETNANCGYHQSDEITLVWYSDSYKSKIYFDGRLFKMISDLAAMASVFFNRELPNYLPEKKHLMPRFDCRVFNVPTIQEAANTFLWRELDCTKNSISMAAQHYYSHKELEGKNSSDKQEMLFQKGVNWNDYPAFFKRGTYIQRKRILTKFSAEELSKLPAKHQARQNPELMIERWIIDRLDLPPLMTIQNREEVILFGAEPNMMKMHGYTLTEMIEAYHAKSGKTNFEEFKGWYENILPLIIKSPTN